MWIKVWQMWAHGEYKNICTYHEVASEDERDELIRSLDEANDWSDKFRGTKFEQIDAPPREHLEKEIKQFESDAKYYKSRAQALKKLLNSLPS